MADDETPYAAYEVQFHHDHNPVVVRAFIEELLRRELAEEGYELDVEIIEHAKYCSPRLCGGTHERN
jgi:hypothetical protein